MRRLKHYVFLVALAILVSSCGEQISYTPIDPQGHYRNEVYQFCCKVPKGWEIREGLQGAELVSLSPKQGAGDKFRENLTVDAVKEAVEPDSESFAKAQLERLTASKATIVSQSDPGEELPWAIYDHQPGELKLRSLAYFKVHHGVGLVFVFSSDQVDAFAPWEELFRKISQSFKFDLSDCPKPKGPPVAPEVTRSPPPA